jgi:hypothetical protein
VKKIFVLGLAFCLILSSGIAQTVNLKGRWKFHVGDDATWATSAFDDSDWETIRVPSSWEDQGFNGYDGFAWYRIKFDGSRLNKETIYYLNLGFIDDADEAYFNDKLIGFSGQCPPKFKTAYNSERKYVLPSYLINYKGDNTIALRVFDVVNSGGIVDGDIGIYSMSEGARLLIDLQGIWMFAESDYGKRITNDKDWEKIMVPGAWEKQGYAHFDGFAWYKRTFVVPINFTKEPLVLMLGKIDDFDRVYLNGKLIGETNDERPYGMSESYQKERAYTIPSDVLRRNGSNTIEILVEDMGNIGGIYEGIVGITTKDNYEKYFRNND